jgi:cytidylate kinase
MASKDATAAASYVAVVPQIRELMVRQQQEIGRRRPNLVTEGRDQGTVVFPGAAMKFFLDATPHERAHRRAAQLRARGEVVEYQEILSDILSRDKRDRERPVGALKPAPDAETIDTTYLSLDEVTELIVARARAGKIADGAALEAGRRA